MVLVADKGCRSRRRKARSMNTDRKKALTTSTLAAALIAVLLPTGCGLAHHTTAPILPQPTPSTAE